MPPGNRGALVFLAQPIAAAAHVDDEKNGEGGEHDERAGVHWCSSDEYRR